MFILLVVILSIVSFSLRLGASGFDLANKIAKSKSVRKSSSGKEVEVLGEVVKIGLATSVSFMRLSAFIVDRVRDLVAFIGGLVVFVDVIILVIVIVCSVAYLSIIPDSSGNANESTVVNEDTN